MIRWVAQGDTVWVPVKVVPGASRTRIMGELDGRLKVAVAAAPEKGRANAALTAFLAKRLGIRPRAVTVVRGHTTPVKTVRVEGVTLDQVKALLA
ncbi:MAG: DUF167 domain-containing protein [Planctomycetota bacterium]